MSINAALPSSNQSTSPQFDVRLDNTSTASVTYVGKAAIGSATSAAVWQIRKIDQSSGMVITWAAGAAFNQIWDNRTSLAYA